MERHMVSLFLQNGDGEMLLLHRTGLMKLHRRGRTKGAPSDD